MEESIQAGSRLASSCNLRNDGVKEINGYSNEHGEKSRYNSILTVGGVYSHKDVVKGSKPIYRRLHHIAVTTSFVYRKGKDSKTSM